MTERVLKSVLSQETDGALVVVRPARLAEEGVTGTVASGIYLGKESNKYDDTKYDYKIKGEDNTLFILNSAGSLAKQMTLVSEGQYVQINYNGKQEITSGKLAGKSVHNFEVLAEEEA